MDTINSKLMRSYLYTLRKNIPYCFFIPAINLLYGCIRFSKCLCINVDYNLINKIIKRYNKRPEITIEFISNIVCDYFEIDNELFHNKTRKREIVEARQIAMYFSKKLTKKSLSTIGKKIGGKDHATVLHACKTINNLMETDKKFKAQIEEIEKNIKL